MIDGTDGDHCHGFRHQKTCVDHVLNADLRELFFSCAGADFYHGLKLLLRISFLQDGLHLKYHSHGLFICSVHPVRGISKDEALVIALQRQFLQAIHRSHGIARSDVGLGDFNVFEMLVLPPLGIGQNLLQFIFRNAAEDLDF
eukprot:Skav208354  [mRNA]  locus=scaffold1964:143457:157139:+ [translate_table: standard]